MQTRFIIVEFNYELRLGLLYVGCLSYSVAGSRRSPSSRAPRLLGLFAGFAANHLGLHGRAKTTAICGDPGVSALIYRDRGADDIFVAIHSRGGSGPGSLRGSLQGIVGV